MFGSVEQTEPAKGYFEGSLHWLGSVFCVEIGRGGM